MGFRAIWDILFFHSYGRTEGGDPTSQEKAHCVVSSSFGSGNLLAMAGFRVTGLRSILTVRLKLRAPVPIGRLISFLMAPGPVVRGF